MAPRGESRYFDLEFRSRLEVLERCPKSLSYLKTSASEVSGVLLIRLDEVLLETLFVS